MSLPRTQLKLRLTVCVAVVRRSLRATLSAATTEPLVSSALPCVEYRALTADGVSASSGEWQLVHGVQHTYQSMTKGNWRGLLHTAELSPLPGGTQFEYRVGDCAGACRCSRSSPGAHVTHVCARAER